MFLRLEFTVDVAGEGISITLEQELDKDDTRQLRKSVGRAIERLNEWIADLDESGTNRRNGK